MKLKILVKILLLILIILTLTSTVHSTDTNNTNLTLSTSNLTKLYNSNDTFNIHLSNNTPLSNQTVNITIINSKQVNKTYYVNTDDNGDASLSINLGIGKYNIITEYQNLKNYNTLSILKTTESYFISDDFMEIYGEGLYYTGKIYDPYGENLIGMHINLTLTRLTNNLSKTYTTTSDYKGEYRLQINLAAGKYTVENKFMGLNTSTLHYPSANTTLNNILVTNEKTYQTDTISSKEINNGVNTLITYINTKGTLPIDLRLTKGFIKIENFIYILTEEIENIKENKIENIPIIDVTIAQNSPIIKLQGTLKKEDILEMNQRINQFIKTNKRLSNYDSTNPIGEINYENYALIFAETIQYYNNNQKLPETLNIDTSKIYIGGYTQTLNNTSITTLNWGSGGNLKANTILMNNIEKTPLTEKVLEESRKGTVLLSFGDGEGKTVLINAGVHGNELSSIAATFKLINTLEKTNIHGKIYVICDICPYTGSTSTRYYNGVNLNSVANIDGTLTNNLIKISQNLNVNYLGDFHCTQPGGKPGKDTVFGTYTPTQESSTISNYIAGKTGVSKIIYQKAGVEYDGAVEDVSNILGIPAVTCEVLTPHGTIRSGTVETSYKMMLALIEYAGIKL